MNKSIALAVLMALVAGGLGFGWWRSDRQSAELQQSLARTAAAELDARLEGEKRAALERSRCDERLQAVSAHPAPEALDVVRYAFGEAARVPFDQMLPNDPSLAVGLVTRLERLGYTGPVTFSARLGRFCMLDEGLAPETLAAQSCSRVGGSEEMGLAVAQRMADGLAKAVHEVKPALKIVTTVATEDAVPYPDRATVSAGEWNRIARENNRVSLRLE